MANGFMLYRLDCADPIRTYLTDPPTVPVPKQVAFGEDSKLVVGGSDNGRVYLFNRKSGELLSTLHHSKAGLVQSIAVGTSLLVDPRHAHPTSGVVLLAFVGFFKFGTGASLSDAAEWAVGHAPQISQWCLRLHEKHTHSSPAGSNPNPVQRKEHPAMDNLPAGASAATLEELAQHFMDLAWMADRRVFDPAYRKRHEVDEKDLPKIEVEDVHTLSVLALTAVWCWSHWSGERPLVISQSGVAVLKLKPDQRQHRQHQVNTLAANHDHDYQCRSYTMQMALFSSLAPLLSSDRSPSSSLSPSKTLSLTMPPARLIQKRCTCEECVERNPNSILMEAKALSMHLHRVRAERAKSTTILPHPPPVSPPLKVAAQATGLDDLAGRLFALTVTDDGPNPNSLTSKLWHSRAEIQSTGPSSDIVAGPINAVSISDLASSFDRLKIDKMSSDPDKSSASPMPPSVVVDRPTAFRRPSSPPVAVISGHRVPKKDQHQASAKAHKLLTNIESRTQRCYRLLLDNSDDATGRVSKELATLRNAVEDIKRATESVKSRKRTVCDALDMLEAELKSRTRTSVSPTCPIEVSSDDHFKSPLCRMDPVAQVATLIGIVCSTIMGIGKRDGTFIMGALSLLIYLSFQAVKGTSGMLHEHILKQVPSTIKSTLAMLDLNTKTVPYAICSCHCTYAPTYAAGSSIATYPAYCTHFPKPEAQCGAPLLDNLADGEARPKKIFLYHDFNDYIGNLLSRSDTYRNAN
ncbi:hypothetical protein EDD15DRAFT_2372598 [Pisolithus albus]|nr:hypothetical protein EDD15DRAFT_2372598 [Pisolithus albus]